MDRDTYKLVRRSPALREALRSVTGGRIPGRRELTEALVNAGVPDSHLDDVLADAERLARRAALGGRPFHLRGESDELTAKWARTFEADDSLLGPLHDRDDDLDPDEADKLAADVDARRRSGALGSPKLRQSTPGPATWQQQR